ncbi:hypothetical protein A0H81_03358 [Grifola frondosa]|uniref:BZIP domain-containing protein n=1 Tax=Grifola frondosa TaxID=5627 RepID=A0A1C7MH32_GRIFR|nr:hypothetical protein A0H81_03358 [Grifola frondosa]
MTPITSLSESHRDASPDQLSSAASERPERSRNAKAQARHRAKRKAYIEQLEQTVTKLQTVLALSPDQVAALPPPLVRIRELEQENELLHREVDELRRQVESKNGHLRPDIGRRSDLPSPNDDRRADRDSKRRRMDPTNVYMNSNGSHSHSPPPPLSIPSSSSYQYSQVSPQPSQYNYARPNSSSLLSPYGLAYQIPGTPSSSSTSSPTFSYELVKIEDDSYSHHAMPHAGNYSSTLSPSGGGQSSLGHWHTYSAERS